MTTPSARAHLQVNSETSGQQALAGHAHTSLLSHLLYGLGDWIYSITVVILAYQLSGRLAAAAAVLLFQAGGRLLGISISPAITASRVRQTALGLGFVRAALIGCLVLITSRDQLWVAVAIAAVLGVLSPFAETARRVITPVIIAPGHDRNLRSRLICRWDQMAMIGGSIAGGLVIVLWNEQIAFVAAAVMTLAAVLLISSSEPSPAVSNATGNDWRSIRHLRAVRALLLALAGGAALGIAIRILLVEIVLDQHGSSELMYGLFIALAGVGAFAGPLSVPRLLGKLPSEIILAGVTAALAVALIAAHIAEPLLLVVPIIIGCGILAITGERAIETVVRRDVPDRELDGALRGLAAVAIAGQTAALIVIVALDYLSGVTPVVVGLTLISIFCAAIPILVYVNDRSRSTAGGGD
ncbi:hypothetical protein BH23CHL2_BH23CHL2_10280 [soil metagenome]